MGYDDATPADLQQESQPPTNEQNLTETPPASGRISRFRLQTLRTKTLLIIVTTLLGLMVVLYLPFRFVLLDSFLTLEQQQMEQQLERAHNAFQNVITSVDRISADYAGWDATYEFMEKRNESYLTATYVDEMMLTNRLNMIVLIDPAGQLVYSKGFDLDNVVETTIPTRFSQFDPTDQLRIPPQSREPIRGMVILPEGVMIVSSRPILTSSYTGEPRGTLIMGRYLNETEIQRLAETTRLQLNFYRLDDPNMPEDVRAILGKHSANDGPINQILNEQTIAGYLPLADLQGNTALLLRVEEARFIYTQGRTSILYFALLLLASGLAFGMVIMVLLERTVLSRLSRLSADIQHISASRDISAKVAVLGNDEIALVASTINRMLSILEQSQNEHRQSEEERARLQEEMIRTQEQFMQMVVHDLKTPLTAVSGFLDILAMEKLTPDQSLMVDSARRSAGGMRHLVATILDTGQMAEGRLTLRPEPTSIVTMLNDCANDLQQWATQEMHRIIVDLPVDLPLLMVDSRLMERVVINLLSNAIKHTPLGTTITLGASVDALGARIWVHDNGPGIAPEVRESLFERFSATPNRSRRQYNTGLGLAFCKLAVEAHNGTIQLQSGPSEGTTFTIILPATVITNNLAMNEVSYSGDKETLQTSEHNH
jgi:signal transduction histidine kinase